MAEEILHTEDVYDGDYAEWPFEEGYIEPTLPGCVFVGWEFNGTVYHPPYNASNNPFGEIVEDVDIVAVWDKTNVYCESDKMTVSYEGDNVEIHYWANNGSEIITSQVELKINNELTTVDYSILSDTESVGNYRICVIKINENLADYGKNLVLYAEYNGFVSDEITIYQEDPYEVVIPESDYFVFNYEWNETDGKDLDSLTVIYVEDKYGNKIDKSFTKKGVGYSFDYGVYSSNSLLCMKHGGDNRTSGAEGAIVCISNIAKTGEVNNLEKVKVEIYANWYNTRNNGNMSINCKAYKSKETSSGEYNDDIIEVLHEDERGNYYTFEPNPVNCDVSWSGFTETMNIKAAGSDNAYISKLECAGKIYSQVCTVVFDIGSGRKSYVRRKIDEGIDNHLYHILLANNNGIINTTTIYLDAEGQHYENLGIYINHWGEDIYMFDNDNDHIELRWPSGSNDEIRDTIKIYKDDLPVSYNSETTLFLNNFTIERKANKKIDIKFDIISNSNNNRRNIDIYFYKEFNDCTPGFNRGLYIYQNKHE